MKQLLLTNWHSMRWIRLIIGLFLIQQAIQYQQPIFGFMAAFFLFQALFNSGCALNGCEVPTFKKK
jgi:hypothetical protein